MVSILPQESREEATTSNVRLEDDSVVVPQTLKESPSKEKTMKKRVRFAQKSTIVGYVPSLRDLSKKEKKDIWLQAHDFDAIKESAKTASYDIRLLCKTGYNVTQSLDNGYERAEYLAESIKNDHHNDEYECEEQNFDEILQDTVQTDMSCFKYWSEHKTTAKCRGLEQWVSSMYHESRCEIMQESKQTVWRLQRRNKSVETIAKRYATMTRPSRIMARWLGHADQLASNTILNKDKKQDIETSYNHNHHRCQQHQHHYEDNYECIQSHIQIQSPIKARRRASMSMIEKTISHNESPKSVASFYSSSVLSDYFGGNGNGINFYNDGEDCSNTNNANTTHDDDVLTTASFGTESCQIRIPKNRRKRGTNFFSRLSNFR